MQKSIGLPFKAELVPKVLDGSKSQTRRLPGIHNCKLMRDNKDVTGKMRGLDWNKIICGYIVRGTPIAPPVPLPGEKPSLFKVWHPGDHKYYELVPRHKPGDIAWMREVHVRDMHGQTHVPVHYIADGPFPTLDERHDAGLLKKYPSIHMPRWASRWERPLKSVRIELIQDITAGDAIAEGLTVTGEAMGMSLYDCGPLTDHKGEPFGTGESTDPTEAFRYLWDRINAKRDWSWNLNRPVIVFGWE